MKGMVGGLADFAGAGAAGRAGAGSRGLLDGTRRFAMTWSLRSVADAFRASVAFTRDVAIHQFSCCFRERRLQPTVHCNARRSRGNCSVNCLRLRRPLRAWALPHPAALSYLALLEKSNE